MPNKPVRQPTGERIVESIHRRIGALERRTGAGGELVDLTPYLTTGFTPVEYFDSDGPFAVAYIDGPRCWLAGAVEYTDASHAQAGSLVGSSPLPPECRPTTALTNVTFTFDWDTTGWNPAPDGNATDAVITARIQADVTRDGYINFESVIANYQGRAHHNSGTFYTGVPDGSTLILEGVGWLIN